MPVSAEVNTYDEALKRIEDAFWRRYNSSPDIQRKLRGKDRDIQLDITDGPSYLVLVRDGKLEAIREEEVRKPDARVSVNEKDFFALFNGELKPLEAYLTRRVKVKAGIKDILFAKSLLGW